MTAVRFLQPVRTDISVTRIAAEADPRSPLIERMLRIDLRRLTVLCISGRKVG
jgi:hypothetical protein